MIITKFGERGIGAEIFCLKKLKEVYEMRKQTEYTKDMINRINKRLVEIHNGQINKKDTD